MMRFLLMDTADARGFVAACAGDELLALLAHPQDEDYSSWLLPSSARVLRQAGLSLSELDAYAVCSGPGSFTGLRVGLTTVKAWAAVHPKPIVAVSRLRAIGAMPVPFDLPQHAAIAAYVDAQRNQVFACLCESREARPIEAELSIGAELVVGLAAFVESVAVRFGPRPVLWRTPDPHLLEALPEWHSRETSGDILEEVAPPLAGPLAALAHQKLVGGDLTDAISLDANYVRRSDAEIFWKDASSTAKI